MLQNAGVLSEKSDWTKFYLTCKFSGNNPLISMLKISGVYFV